MKFAKFAVGALALVTARAALAGVALHVSDVTVPAGTTGTTVVSLDVYADVSGGPYAIAAYNVHLDLVPAAGASFLDTVASSPTYPSVFGAEPNFSSLGSPYSIDVEGDLAAGQSPLLDGDGLFAVRIGLPAYVNGTFDVEFGAGSTFLFDGLADPVTIDALAPGRLVVTPTPEPSGTLCFSLLSIPLLCRKRR